jgi:hypothetical protein
MFQVYVPDVSSISDVRCKCFYLDVAKIDLDVASVSGVSYVIRLLQLFHLDRCCICLQ